MELTNFTYRADITTKRAYMNQQNNISTPKGRRVFSRRILFFLFLILAVIALGLGLNLKRYMDRERKQDNIDGIPSIGILVHTPGQTNLKDERKTRKLAECICHQDKYGKQDVALVIQEARDKLEEKD